ncbi:hypothetical protein [Bradyrhizobium sp. CB2312]|uniref:hypothetical protein n=1 Tax=Bradyrhizobium sp. CB2312 TaxID=3039155 RepID=UPI0024B0E07E|nr:hypothetical protein [Bradyrhizobium sp. CB2312]WFU77237.1 hypothetical protein QA642_26625 [Bradyrhizobium sp. CB2312]
MSARRRFNADFAELYGRSPSSLRSSNNAQPALEKPGAEIEPVGQAQHEHEQSGGCEQGEMLENERTRRSGGNNGFLRNRHDELHYENDSWPPMSSARIKHRDLQSNY